MSLLNRKMSKDLVVCVGTDIPPMSNHEFGVWQSIEEIMELKKINVLSMDEIFEHRTFSKKERFDLISQLIKNKVIRKRKIDHSLSEYTSIPLKSYRKATEIRVYYKLSKKERMLLKRNYR